MGLRYGVRTVAMEAITGPTVKCQIGQMLVGGKELLSLGYPGEVN